MNIIFDKSGVPITTIKTESERSWVLSSEGKCTFDMAVTDPKAHKSILAPGNFIYIDHPDLQAWAGMIDDDEDFNEDGTISYTAWSGEHILKYRRSTINKVLTGSSAGLVISRLLDMANQAGDTLIRAGEIYKGGKDRMETLDGKSIYSHIESLAKRAGVEWNVDPVIDDNGHLSFVLNVYEKRGENSALALKEGHNIIKRGTPLRRRSGNIINDLLALGDASTDERPHVVVEDKESQSVFGLRQGTKDFDGNTEIGTLTANAEKELVVSAWPINIHSIEALNKGETFKKLRLGNTHQILAHSYGRRNDGQLGVDEPGRVIGMRYKEKSDTIDITLFEDDE